MLLWKACEVASLRWAIFSASSRWMKTSMAASLPETTQKLRAVDSGEIKI